MPKNIATLSPKHRCGRPPIEIGHAMCGNSGLTEEFVVKRRFAQSLSIKIMVPVVVACLSAPVAAAQSAPAAAPTSQDARMKWFREAKFGLFIHWGLYAIPAGEWKGQPVAGIGEWIMNRAKIPVKEYEQLAAGFNPVKFNAEEWVQMAEDAGM